jgi:MFS family permease
VSSTEEPNGGSLPYVWLLTIVAALGGLLFGFDTAIIAGAIGFLRECFGLGKGFETGWAASSVLLGCAAGAAAAGFFSDRLGRKRTLILAGLLFFVSAIGTALPQSVAVFVVFRLLAGVAVGAASISSPMYIAEVAPARMRGKMVSVNQLAIVSGLLVAYFVNYFIAAYGTAVDRGMVTRRIGSPGVPLTPEAAEAFIVRHGSQINRGTAERFLAQRTRTFLSSRDDANREAILGFLAQNGVPVEKILANMGHRPWNVEHGWRWMFGFATLPAVLFLGLLALVPESPRWLTKQGRVGEAGAILTRINGPDVADAELAAIQQAIAEESGSLAQLVQPGMKAALVIGVALAVLQQITGINVFFYYATEIFEAAGSGVDAALLQQALVGAVNVAFTLVAIRTVDRWGRKPLMLVGSTGMGITLLGMAAAWYSGQTAAWVLWLILGYVACFALSVGPVTWVILSEIFPTRIRGRAMAVATVCLWLADFVVTQSNPMMRENKWLADEFNGAFPMLLYGAFCIVSVLFVWRYVPETKGKSLEEIERSWKKG